MAVVLLNTEDKIIKGLKHINKDSWIKPIERMIMESLDKKEYKIYKDEKTGKVWTEGLIAQCNIYSDKYKLLEVKQVFSNGKETERMVPVGGKVPLGTNVDITMVDEISEELHISRDLIQKEFNDGKIKKVEVTNKENESVMFKGTFAKVERHMYEWEMPLYLYKTEYCERQVDKVSYFRWVKR